MKNPLIAVKQLLTELTSDQRKDILEMLQDENLVEEILGMMSVPKNAVVVAVQNSFVMVRKQIVGDNATFVKSVRRHLHQ